MTILVGRNNVACRVVTVNLVGPAGMGTFAQIPLGTFPQLHTVGACMIRLSLVLCLLSYLFRQRRASSRPCALYIQYA